MQYEIYIDSLFLLTLGLNLYLLELVNGILIQTVTRKRILMGALAGSFLSMIPLLLPINLRMAVVSGFVLSMVSMIRVAFKCHGWKSYLRLIERCMIIGIFLGALIHYLLSRCSKDTHMPVLGIWVFAAIGFLLLRGQLNRRNQWKSHCKVILKNHGTIIRLEGLVDTGNTLIEPVSGSPVAVLDKKIFDNLFWKQAPTGFRIIPYHSIDKKNGLMPGYLIPDMQVEWGGICMDYQNIYVAVRPEEMGNAERYSMIINPKMLKKEKIG